jgi:hypothetical protein
METRTSGSVRGMKKLTCSQAERFIPTLPSLERANSRSDGSVSVRQADAVTVKASAKRPQLR